MVAQGWDDFVGGLQAFSAILMFYAAAMVWQIRHLTHNLFWIPLLFAFALMGMRRIGAAAMGTGHVKHWFAVTDQVFLHVLVSGLIAFGARMMVLNYRTRDAENRNLRSNMRRMASGINRPEPPDGEPEF